MNKHVKPGYWGDSVDYRDILKKIEEIGPTLEANAPADEEAGELTKESFEALKPLRFSHLMATEELGGAQMRPTEVLQLIEAVTWWSGSAGAAWQPRSRPSWGRARGRTVATASRKSTESYE